MDNAAASLPNKYVLDAAAVFADQLRSTGASTGDMARMQTQYLIQARQDAADFLNCRSQEIALVRSTSQALGTLACSLPLRRGDNVLVCDLEYQASTACWHPRAEQVGFEVRRVQTSGGCITPKDFQRYMDAHTRAILLAAVQEINGFRADVKAVCELAREHGCCLIVDGIQEAGAMQVDVQELGIDFYCAGGKKWIGNPFGTGFLYIRAPLLEELKPPYYSYLDLQVPSKYYSSGQTNFVQAYLAYLEDPGRNPFDSFRMKRDAAVFEAGGYDNYLGAMGLSRALQVLKKQGMASVERRILSLTQRLRQGLQSLGLVVTSPCAEKHSSSIISFALHDLRDCNVDRERQLVSYLRERNIFVSLRCSTLTGGIRVSPHYYTPDHHIDIFLNAVADFTAGTASSAKHSWRMPAAL